jgi:hypothetical protein
MIIHYRLFANPYQFDAMKQHSCITSRFSQTYSGGAIDAGSGQKYLKINGK